MHLTIMSAVFHPSRASPRRELSTSWSSTSIKCVLFLMTTEQISLLPEQYNSIINNGYLWIPFNEEKSQKRKPNQTLSKLHQPKNSSLPPLFGWSVTSPNSFAEMQRSQSRILAVRSSRRHPTARNSSQLSCTGRKEREMFPVTTTSAAVWNTQFIT